VISNLPAATTNISPPPEYHITVGSFRDFANARELINQVEIKGYHARILGTEKGFYRVTAGTYTGHEQALTAVKTVFQDYDEAWVLTN
jgi:cell division protein FtsN